MANNTYSRTPVRLDRSSQRPAGPSSLQPWLRLPPDAEAGDDAADVALYDNWPRWTPSAVIMTIRSRDGESARPRRRRNQ